VHPCTPSELLIHDWVINDSDGGNFPNGEANRDAHKGEAMDEIGGTVEAVEGIDDPGRFVCEVGGGAERRGRLLPDDLVVGDRGMCFRRWLKMKSSQALSVSVTKPTWGGRRT
jgi:hypothetical protein